MKKLLMASLAAGIMAACGSGYATPTNGFFFGLGGGWNDPDYATGSGTINSVNVSGKEQNYFLNAHTGYLFGIDNNPRLTPTYNGFGLGPQVSYNYYGQYKLTGDNG